jgi:hypothetical protein
MSAAQMPQFQFSNNNTDLNNYNALVKRKSGQKFDVNAQGELITLTFSARVKYQFDRGYQKKVQGRVAQVIKSLISLQTQNPTTVVEGKTLLQCLGRLSPKVFNRTDLRNTAFYTQLHTAVKVQVKTNNVKETNPGDDAYWDAVAECQIADWSGIHFVRNGGGTSGNYRMKDLDGKTRFLFKPVAESPHGPENPYRSIRIRNAFQQFLGMRANTSVPEEKGHVREAFASKVCEELTWNVGATTLVPTTRVGSLESASLSPSKNALVKGSSKEGSIQLWVDGCEDGHSRVLNSSTPSTLKKAVIISTAVVIGMIAIAAIAAAIVFFPPAAAICGPIVILVALTALPVIATVGFVAVITQISLAIALIREKSHDPNEQGFKRAALLAYLLCNLDFNPGNMLFKKNSNDLYAIDFWFSMPNKIPETWLDIRNMHLWGQLQIADKKITAADIQPILTHFNNLKALAVNTFGASSPEVQHFDERWEVIKQVSAAKGSYKDLAQITTSKQMNDWVGP